MQHGVDRFLGFHSSVGVAYESHEKKAAPTELHRQKKIRRTPGSVLRTRPGLKQAAATRLRDAIAFSSWRKYFAHSESRKPRQISAGRPRAVPTNAVGCRFHFHLRIYFHRAV